LYADFLALRLSDSWSRDVVPQLRAWAAGEEIAADAYLTAKKRGSKTVARNAG
jgi:histone H3/H4